MWLFLVSMMSGINAILLFASVEARFSWYSPFVGIMYAVVVPYISAMIVLKDANR